MKSMIWSTIFFTSSLFLNTSSLAQGNATRIQFDRGSYCGAYSGDFSRERQFVLNLSRNQIFTVRNIGTGLHYDISVFGPTGKIRGRNVSQDQLNYNIPAKGDYYIRIKSTNSFNAIEFCAY